MTDQPAMSDHSRAVFMANELRQSHRFERDNEMCVRAADLIDALRERVAALEAGLLPFAEEPTIDEILRAPQPDEWAKADPMRRVEMLGERKRKNTANILAARALLPAAAQKE